MKLVSFVSLSFLFACGAPGTSGGGDDDAPMPDSGMQSTQLDPMDCTAFAQSFATAASSCGMPLPSGAQSTFETFCKKGINAAAMCGGSPSAGLDCFASPDANDWVCQLGEPYPSCNGDISAALGALCVIALGNPQCATGVKCTFDADCSNGLKCNSRTDQCMSETAYCIGLPCTFDADCPNGEKCNSAENACVGN